MFRLHHMDHGVCCWQLSHITRIRKRQNDTRQIITTATKPLDHTALGPQLLKCTVSVLLKVQGPLGFHVGPKSMVQAARLQNRWALDLISTNQVCSCKKGARTTRRAHISEGTMRASFQQSGGPEYGPEHSLTV